MFRMSSQISALLPSKKPGSSWLMRTSNELTQPAADRVALGHVAAAGSQRRVGVDDRPRTRRLRQPNPRRSRHVAERDLAGWDVQQVVEATVAVGVVVEGIAVRLAAATFIEHRELGLVVVEEDVLPVQGAREAILDQVVRTCASTSSLAWNTGHVAQLRAGGRTGQRADFVGIGVGVGQAARTSRFRRTASISDDGELLAAALAGGLGDDRIVVGGEC